MKHGRFLFTAVIAGLAALSVAQNDVPKRMVAKLGTGVNVTRWFCYLGTPADTSKVDTYFTKADFDALKRLKTGFVRLCISPDVIYRAGKPEPKTLASIDKAVDRLNRAGMVVIWDLHDNGQLKLDAPNADNSGFVTFWEEIARHYAGKHEASMMFELVNEPVFQRNPADWYALQERTVAAVRAIDPKRTIMVSGTAWSGIDTLATMKPLEAKNLVYTFHCYDPFLFTHQGASWVGDVPAKLKAMPFPATPEAASAILDRNDPKYAATIVSYGKEGFDKAYLRARVAKGMAFGKQHNVPIVLGEFGAYPPVSPPDSRRRWFTAMREVIDELKVPNAIWGYDDGLGLGRTLEAGKLKLDPNVLESFYRITPF